MEREIVFTLVLCALFACLAYLYESVVLKNKRVRWKLEKQGIRGPQPSILLGNVAEMKEIHRRAPSNHKAFDVASNSHDWPSTVFSHLLHWRNQYGAVFVYSMGSIQFLSISEVEMVKEISHITSLSLGKPAYLSEEHGPLLGRGIISSNGPIWAHNKKIIAPQFYLNKVKGMVSLMVESTTSLLSSWDHRIETGGGTADITVDDDLRSLSGDIISRACFGSSYSLGEQIFSKLRTLQKLMKTRPIGIPGLRFVPTKTNVKVWRLEKEIHAMILAVVNQRTEANVEKDLLQMILEGAGASGSVDSPDLGITREKFIVDNCKNIYFAGHETTAITASWVLMLLAAYPAWQTRVRDEVQAVCKGESPTVDMLRSMKILTMVIQETLRLYPPGVHVTRKVFEDIQVRDILIPKGTNVQVPISILHQDTELWGPDAHKFKPDRFENGISRACKVPQAYIPFGVGTRACIGQNLALIELKVILSLALSKFSFNNSPAYRHSPVLVFVIEPEHGVNLLVQRV